MMRRSTNRRVALLAGVSTAALGAATAGAQDASGADNLEEIVVTATGTHISGFDAPTPLTTVSGEDLKVKAVQRVSDLIVDVPAFAANQNFGRSSVPIGASNFDLRGLGTARTLLLLDGRRVAPTEPTGTIDTNIIPATLIKSLEIVTGGASAAYGSDAVSGVVNITLDDRFEGVKSDFQYGRSTYGDVSSPAASVAAGHAFADGRLHLVGALDYYENHGQLSQSSRPWGRNSTALITNPNGPPNRLQADNARYSQLTNGGVAALNNIPALRGIQFGPGGTVLPFNYGTSVGTMFMIGGDGGSMAGDANVLPEIGRKAGFTRATFDINDKLSVYADALYADIDAFSDSAYAVSNRAPLSIRIDNAFLPQQVSAIMAANNVNTFTMGRIVEEEGKTNTTIDNKVQRYGLGIKGEITDTWHWDAAVQESRNDYHREDGNNQIVRRYNLGIDSVINPANGQPICRSLLNAPNSADPDIANCVPVNVFGVGSISQQALSYFTGTAVLDSQQKQTLVNANLQGSLFENWAGFVSLAVGAEYRKDSIDAHSDPISQAGGWFAVNSKPLSGDVNVKEAYTEVVVPLLRDKPFGFSLDVNGAARITDYSTSGQVTTWKTGINYSPTADLRFRGTLSRDIRAPSINELFSGQNQFVTALVDPRNNSNPTVQQFTGGNPNLTPETSKAYTIGVVYQPSWASSLRMSLDYYSFEITDAIASLNGQQFLDGCFIRNQQQLCDAITQNASGVITRVSSTLINAAAAETSGVDAEVGYGLPFAGGKMDFRLLGTYVDKLTTTINGTTTDTVGQLGSESAGGIPKWRFVASARYSRPASFGVGVLVRYVDSGFYRTDFVEGIDIDDNSIPSRTYVDLDFSKFVGESFELYAKINNVFNLDPPEAPSPITEPNYNGGFFHDRIGRYFKLGARYQF
jgi:outer membrane receptor protein involved in Fe transport